MDPTLQDNVVIGSGTFHHICQIGCTFNLHSIINNGLTPGGQDLSRKQTVFFLPIDPKDENQKDPEHVDISVPHRAKYVHNAWKKHHDVVFWVDINLAIRKGLTFYQTRSNAINLQGTLPAHCVSKLKDWKLEKCCLKDDICLLDHHQRSHWNTITIGPEGMVNWFFFFLEKKKRTWGLRKNHSVSQVCWRKTGFFSWTTASR